MALTNSVKKITQQVTPAINKGTVKLANGLSKFKGSDAILPVILIESCVTGGRTLQSYKRGGKTEAKERFVEQGVSAVVWLYGVKVLNKIADKIGAKFMKKEHIEVDVAKDALRQPFENIVKDNKVAAAAFKFSKIAVNTTIATAFIGFILPKMIKKMTNKDLKKQQENKGNTAQLQNTNIQNATKTQPLNTTQALIQKNLNEELNTTQAMVPALTKMQSANVASNNKTNYLDNFVQETKNLTFKGAEKIVNGLLNISNKLENDTKYRLMSTDVGIIAGRTMNARNKYEAREFLFRDTASIYFYLFCADHVLKGLNKASGNVDIHPKAALAVADLLIKNNEKLGNLENIMKENIKVPDELFEGVKGDVIPLEKFKKYYSDLPDEIMKKAEKMSELQPIFDGKRYLSKQQIKDVLSSKWTSDPEFLYETYRQITNGKSTQADKYVSKDSLEKARKSLDDFVQTIIDYAKKKGKDIDVDLIKRCLNKNLILNSIFTAAGIGISGTALAVAIPKIQCLMTEKATGSKAFPGVTQYEK
ncbi:MAG: hypothetical protein E7Z91_05105 [Cyanobacteria bacterium SIG30]|nr:hypothetical protein [Cyanobacteria bacterium SIG30]